MKLKLFLTGLSLLCMLNSRGQGQLIQGTIKPGPTFDKVDVFLKPNFSNNTEYLFQLQFPMAFPATTSPTPTGLSVVLDPTFVANFGNNYSVTVYPLANNTANTVKYYVISMIRGGTGASLPQTWTAGVEFKVMTVTFLTPSGLTQIRLADFQDGGSDGQGNFYTVDGNANYYVTSNSIGNFYPTPGQSALGGDANEGYVFYNISACSPGTVSGTSPLCIGQTATYTSSGDPGGTWSSTNTAVATVHPTTGVVTAVGAGTTDITYTVCSPPLSAFKTLTVDPDVSAGTVSGASPLCIGQTATYTSNGTAGGTWSSTNTSVATVNASTGLVTAVGAGTTNITYTVTSGCGSPVSAFKTLTVDPNVSAGTVSGASPLCIGQTATYTSNGTPGGSWSSTNTSVATVDPSTGVVTAVGAGTTNITYTVSSGCGSPVSAFKTLTVDPNVSAGTVSGTSPLCIGQTATYTSNGTPGGSWSSTNTSVATVNASTGLVTAVGAGTTNITYTVTSGCGSPVSAFKSLTVDPNVSAGTVSGTSPLCIGQTATYTSNGTPGGSWSSTNTSVATVNASTGLVTAVGAGTTNITYTVSSGCGSPVSAFKTLTVDPNVSAGTVSGTSPLCIGQTATYTSNGTPGGSWSSTNTSVATVNASTGLVTAVGAGTTNITYTVTSGCGSPVSAFKTLTVSPNANAGTVSGTSPLCIGQTATYTSDGDAGGTWSSSNTAVATVHPTTGVVTAIAAGTTNITYTVSAGCNSPVSAFKTLTVSLDPSPGTVSGASPLCIGQTTTYSSNGDAGGSWSSSNTSVATVHPSTGVVTAVGAGTTNIIYTVLACNGTPLNAFKTLTVDPNVSAGTVSGTSPLCIGQTATYTSNGTPGGSWSSTNTSVATVNASTGLVTAVGAGTTNITYTVSSGCGSPVSAFKTLTVSPNANAGTVSGTSPLCVGQTATYSSNGDAGGTWSSTNTAVATVHPTTGVVTAIAAGTTNITYTVSAGCNSPVSAFKTLTVSLDPSPGTVSGASPLCIGQTTTYSSNGDAGGSWSSSNTSVATVHPSTGVVTAVGAGTTNIIYTVLACNGTPLNAFKTLTVDPNVSAGTVSGASPLCIGQTTTYSSNGDAGGSWSSSNTSVATVHPSTGVVTAVGAGTTNIIYTVLACNGTPLNAFKTLTVSPNANAGTVSGTSPLCVGQTATYSSNGDAGGTWSSTNTAVATVNASTGLVTAVGAGTTNITYTVSSGCGSPVSAFKTLTVDPNVSAGTVSGTSPLCIGQTATYTSNGTPGGSWSSTNTSVATVNASTGLVTAVGAGTTNITYTVSSGCGSPVSAFKTLTVSPNANAGTVSGTSPLCVGQTATYSSNGDAGGTWSSTNTAVATVHPTTGVVTAIAAGTTNITYTVSAGCNSPASAFKTLTVSLDPSPGTVSGASPLCIGQTTTYSSNGDAGGSWSSSNTSVATVHPSTGVVTAVGAGTTNIIYTVLACNGTPLNAFKTLTVDPNVSAGTVSGASPLCIGQTATYTSNGTPGGSWSSTNTSVATVNASTGLVTAVGAGTTNITYTVSSGCGIPVSAFKTLTVSPNANAGTVSGTSPLCVGQTATYSSNGDAGGSWSSTNTSVATVHPTTGVVTALAAGTTNITYTVSTGCNSPVSAFKTLTVSVCTTSNVHCTYTQGYYGNAGGSSCNGTTGNLTTTALLTQLLSSGNIVAGRPGYSVIVPNSSAGVSKLIEIMPGGGTAKALNSGNCIITDPCINPYLKNGRFNNVLLSQTITLMLNSRMNGGSLNAFPIQNGWIVTQQMSGCGSSATTVNCASTPHAIRSYRMNANVANYLTNFGTVPATVEDLINLANDVLGRVKVPGTAGVPSFADINNAVDVINNAFDKCRSFIGYYNCEVTCANIGLPDPCNPLVVRHPALDEPETVNRLKVSAFPNPYTEMFRLNITSPVSGWATILFYDMSGIKVHEMKQYVLANRATIVQVKSASVFRHSIIYRVQVDKHLAQGIALKPSEH